MKTLTRLNNKKIKIVVLLFVFTFLGNTCENLYAQDPQLFEHTWYLHQLVIDDVINVPPINDEIPFVSAQFYENGILETGMCENSGSGDLEYIGTDGFLVLEMVFLQGECYQNVPFNQDFSNLYQDFWNPLVGSATIIYNITEDGEIIILTITSPNGDYAIYKSEAPLSIDSFSNFEFVLYPNPTAEILNFKNLNISIADVAVNVFDLNGKPVISEAIEITNSNFTLNVSDLNCGVYFLTIENKDGYKQTFKFIKQ